MSKNEFQFFFDDGNDSAKVKEAHFCKPSSYQANTSEHIFKFPNLDQNSILGDPQEMTGVTQNDNDPQNQSEDINLDTSQADCDFENNNERELQSIESLKPKVDNPVSFRLPSKNQKSKAIRRDVINKTIFRIIRRYFLMLLEKAVPDYKSQKKHNLMNMLRSFSEFLFPNNKDSLEMSKIMSALMFRREVLVSQKDIFQDENLKVFLNIQSKYSHKLLSPALSNIYFRIMFEKFIEHGIAFFDQDENVENNPTIYKNELEKIKTIFHSLSI